MDPTFVRFYSRSFYRHMPALVENNFIYIAQPPLFKVTRKKESRYLTSEKEMDDYLLSLGVADVQLRDQRTQSEVDPKQMIDLILEIENLMMSIERKAIPFREFLEAKREDGSYPRYQVTLKEPVLLYSEDQFLEIAREDEKEQKRLHEETLASLPAEEITDVMRSFRPRPLPYIELYKEEGFVQLMRKLEQHKLTLEDYLIAKAELFAVLENQESVFEAFTLKELIDFVRGHGRKGVEIQRYKGLGEMNADQLWETTMDPSKRTLVQVKLSDAIAADHMFTMLMGEDVPPRRAFIESHALSVKNLDI